MRSSYFKDLIELFFILSIVLFIGSSVFATMNVLNTKGVSTDYFGISNNIAIIHNQNFSKLNVSLCSNFECSKINFSEVYNFGDCSYGKCLEINLSSFINKHNVSSASDFYKIVLFSFNSSSSGTFSNMSLKKYIYYDNSVPSLTILSANLDSSKKELNIYFNVSDENLSRVVVTDLTNKKILFNKSLHSSYFKWCLKLPVSDLTTEKLSFKALDLAQNERVVVKKFHIGDLSHPKLNDFRIVQNYDNSFDFWFNVSDNSLIKEYKLKNKNLFLGESVNVKNLVKSVKLPFNNGELTFLVYDNCSNVLNKSINLSMIDSLDYPSYLNTKRLILRTKYNSCFLRSIDNITFNNPFKRVNNGFVYDFNFSKSLKTFLKIECISPHYTLYKILNVCFDFDPPTAPKLYYKNESDGSVNLFWDRSVDNFSEVTYKLFRDNRIIYEGKNNNFVDSDVHYPTEYRYVVKSYDKAGNFNISNILNIVPKKITIKFKLIGLNSVSDSNTYKLEFSTEKNLSIKFFLKNNNTLIKKFSFNSSKTRYTLRFNIKKGTNLIFLKLRDRFGNRLDKVYTIIFHSLFKGDMNMQNSSADRVANLNNNLTSQSKGGNLLNRNGLSQKNLQMNMQDFKKKVLRLNSTKKDQVSNEHFISFVFYLVFFIFMIILLLILSTEYLKDKSSDLPKWQKNLRREALKDKLLEKDFNRIKRNRIFKENMRKREKERERVRRERMKRASVLEKQKLQDLALEAGQKREIQFSKEKRSKFRQSYKRAKTKEYNLDLKTEQKRENKFIKNIFREVFSFYKSSKKELSDLEIYLQNRVVNRTKSNFKERNIVGTNVEKVTEKSVDKENKTEETLSENKAKSQNETHLFLNNEFNEYLSKVTQNKRRKFYFFEKELDRKSKDE